MILLFDNLIEGRSLAALSLLLKQGEGGSSLGSHLRQPDDKDGGRGYGNQRSSSAMISLPACQVTAFELHILKWC